LPCPHVYLCYKVSFVNSLLFVRCCGRRMYLHLSFRQVDLSLYFSHVYIAPFINIYFHSTLFAYCWPFTKDLQLVQTLKRKKLALANSWFLLSMCSYFPSAGRKNLIQLIVLFDSFETNIRALFPATFSCPYPPTCVHLLIT
jgi:hypothetical protein